MRFKTYLLEAIRDNRKTVTRRLVRTTECPYKVGNIYSATNRPRWTAARTKSNSNGGWFSVPIKIVDIRHETLLDINEDDARREGMLRQDNLSARERFFWTWGAIHGFDGQNPDVWRIEFKPVPESWK